MIFSAPQYNGGRFHFTLDKMLKVCYSSGIGYLK